MKQHVNLCHCQATDLGDGASQRQRFLVALDPANFPADGRSLEELLVFTRRLAAQIRFFDTPEEQAATYAHPQADKSWKAFFRSDAAVLSAEISLTDLAALARSQAENQSDFEEKTSVVNFRNLFDVALGIARRLEGWRSNAAEGSSLRQELELLIRSSLREQLVKAQEWDKGLMVVNQGQPLELDLSPLDQSDFWNLPAAPVLDDSIYVGDTLDEKLTHAAGYATDIFNAFFQGMKDLVSRSGEHLRLALEEQPGHQPHLALFLAFVQLFRLAQQQLDALTQKHLDFYYRDVLRLQPKSAQPDSVNLIFELAKEFSEYLVPVGSALPAPKDALKKEVIYRTDRELVVNKAKVKELKTIFLDKTLDDSSILKVLANPVAKSADGLGAPFETPDGKWLAFGGLPTPKERNLALDICRFARIEEKMPQNKAEIGFALASPDFLLAGGQRKILILFEQPVAEALKKGVLAVRLSSEKGWLRLEQKGEAVTDQPKEEKFDGSVFATGFDFKDNTLHVGITLSEPAIVPFLVDIHPGRNYPTFNPVVEILMNTENLAPQLLISPDSVRVQVVVGSLVNKEEEQANSSEVILDGVQDLLLQNNDGVIDPAQAIHPFTQTPNRGNSFHIGCKEFSNKDAEALNVQVDWSFDARSQEFGPALGASAAVLGLKKPKEWSYLKNSDAPPLVLSKITNTEILRDPLLPSLFWASPFFNFQLVDFPTIFSTTIQKPAVAQVKNPLRFKAVLNKVTPNTILPFSLKAEHGYIRYTIFGTESFTLTADFDVLARIARMLQIKSIALAYQTRVRGLTEGRDELFHIYPFGVAETFPADQTDRLELLTDGLFVPSKHSSQPKTWHLLPQFRFGSAAAPTAANQYNQLTIQQGNLYLGIENLNPPQNLSLLFHLAEGSANDEEGEPPIVHWSYLSNNEWRPLPDDYLISDGTFGLQTTGVILFDVPQDATKNNTILPAGLHWLCASVDYGVERMPMFVDVIAQAVSATFDDQGNDPAHYLEPLPAESISQLAVKVKQIKKVQQPFASFGGKPPQQGRHFYTFAAERLRHKARAVTPWDYEHLVLEQFPSIYKVKAIAHTDPACLCRHTDDSTHCCGPQIAPGHVLVVPIANLQNRNAVNVLQPKTSRRLLLEIGSYLRLRTSPFVHVHVKNPRYEEILTRFKVKFHTGIDKGFYLRQLNEDLLRYLTPWAFDDFAEAVFGGSVYASAVINFIEERPYVDFITDFEMLHCKEECCPPEIDSTLGTDLKNLQGKVTDVNGNVLGGVQVTVKRTLMIKLTESVGGTYAIPATPRDTLIFSKKGYVTKQELIGTRTGIDVKLDFAKINWDEIDNCTDVATYVEGQVLTSETIVEACSPDVILVSAPKHLISLYVEPAKPNPCEKTKINNP